MKKILISILAVFTAAVPVACTSIFYQPDQKEYFAPETFGFSHEEFDFPVEGGNRLHVWKMASKKKPNRGAILQFHGNAENMSSHFISLVWLVDEGFDLYTFDYRGYGKSSGAPNRKKIFQDSVKLIRHIEDLSARKGQKLIIYGQSLGAIIALRALAEVKERKNIAAVVIEGGFPSYKKIARNKIDLVCFQPFSFLLSLFFIDSYSARDHIKELSGLPFIVMHGEYDYTVPEKFGREIFELASPPKVYIQIKKGGHMNWLNPRLLRYRPVFARLLDDAVSGRFRDRKADVLSFD